MGTLGVSLRSMEIVLVEFDLVLRVRDFDTESKLGIRHKKELGISRIEQTSSTANKNTPQQHHSSRREESHPGFPSP